MSQAPASTMDFQAAASASSAGSAACSASTPRSVSRISAGVVVVACRNNVCLQQAQHCLRALDSILHRESDRLTRRTSYSLSSNCNLPGIEQR